MTETKESPGRIITFYSYKGGAGRSMTLANIAWILASNGKRVLVVDWDLEAPGLHRYFYPFLVDKDLTSSDGVIDMVIEFAAASVTPVEGTADVGEGWYREHADILRYATALEWTFPEPGTLDFVSSGRQGPSYATRVNSFNWQDFYERMGGGLFIEAVKKRMQAEYDYVLIDSRTGVSDTSGICTIQIPDYLVVCFTLNNQSIEGAAAVAESVQKQRGKSGIRVFPIPTRVEFAEKERLDSARVYSRERFSSLIDHIFKKEQDLYWGQVEVVYQPFYAYEEILATFGDSPGQTNSLLASMERITAYLTERTVNHAEALDDVERQRFVEMYSRRPPSIALQRSAGGKDDITNTEDRRSQRGGFAYICYSPIDAQEFALQLAEALADGSPSMPVWLDRRDLNRGEDSDYQIAEAIRTCTSLLFIMTPDSVGENSICKEEWTRALSFKKPVVPLRLQSTIEAPFRLANRQTIDFAGEFDQDLARLRKHLKWLDSPAGLLQSMKDRLADMQRDLRLAEDPAQRVRLQNNVIQIQKQIVDQERTVNSNQAAQDTEQTFATPFQSESQRQILNSQSFEYDIFISYAHNDNKALVGGGRGWVDNFSEGLEVRLRQLLGYAPRIWRDPRLQGNEFFADSLISKVSDTLLIIPVISPSFLNSEWCLRELREFLDSAKQQGGINIGSRSRIFKVIKSIVPEAKHPVELQELLGYEFFELDKVTSRPSEFSQELGPHRDPRYWNKLDDLAWTIKETLADLRKASDAQLESVEVPITKKIYLAETTSDLSNERDRIKRELQQHGYYVLPNKQLPLNSQDLRSAVAGSLKQCIISIHLIGENYGVIPEGESQSLLRLQYDLSAERSIDPTFYRVVWMPRGLESRGDILQQQFIEHLRNDRKGAELLQMSLEELKNVILDKLEKARHATQYIHEQGPLRTYVICGPQDIDEATPLIEYLDSLGFEVLLPVFEGDESIIFESHREHLLLCDAAIIVYGRTDANWLRIRLGELQKIFGYGRSQHMLLEAVYISGPRTPDKEFFTSQNVIVIKNYDTFSAEALQPYITQLSDRVNPGTSPRT